MIDQNRVCFTGHRKIAVSIQTRLRQVLEQQIEALIYQGYQIFMTGGALGFDTLAAALVLRLRQIHPQIELHLAIPCGWQTRGWRAEDVRIYRMIQEQADFQINTFQPGDAFPMQTRNRYMVDHSDLCVAFQQHQKGGTAYTTRYAASRSIPIINLADFFVDDAGK